MRNKVFILIMFIVAFSVQTQAQKNNTSFNYLVAKAKQEAYQKQQNNQQSVISNIQVKTYEEKNSEVEDLKRQVEELKRQVNGQQNSGGNVGSQSGGAQSRQEFRPCFSCGGTRKCVTCVGDGIYTIWTGNRSSSCTCSGCNGSGICNICHGTGGTYETVYD